MTHTTPTFKHCRHCGTGTWNPTPVCDSYDCARAEAEEEHESDAALAQALQELSEAEYDERTPEEVVRM